MYLEILTLLAVISLALILAFYNRRQADALRGVERMVKDFLAIQIRDRRDKYLAKLEDLDATEWLEKLINARVSSEVKLLDSLRIVPEVFAAEIQTEDGRKIVVSTKAKAILKRYDKISRSRGNNAADRIASVAAKPILNKKFEIFEINMVEETEYFDVEAELVSKALGLSWKNPTRLWIYIVG